MIDTEEISIFKNVLSHKVNHQRREYIYIVIQVNKQVQIIRSFFF